jgi:hypothetical protein
MSAFDPFLPLAAPNSDAEKAHQEPTEGEKHDAPERHYQ